MKKKQVGVLIALLVVLAIGWYWGSPRWTLNEMKAAAEAGDSDKLASYIDFPALRSSMKEELKANAAVEMAKPGADGMAALGAAFAMNMVDNMVDGMVTPTTMRKVFLANKDKGPQGITKVDATGKDIVIDRDGLDHFRLRGTRDGAGGLIFTRHGLGWMLSGMSLPAK